MSSARLRRNTIIIMAAAGINVLLFVVLPHWLMNRSSMVIALSDEMYRPVEMVRFEEREKESPDQPEPDEPLPPEKKPDPVPPRFDTITLHQPPMPPSIDLAGPVFDLVPGLSDGPMVAMPEAESPPVIPVARQTVFDESEVDRIPVAVIKGEPEYPYRAMRLKLDGEVRVRFLVNPDGRVSDISILGAKPPNIFDRSVLTALSGWRFKPGQIAGRPVATWVTTTIIFNLRGS